MPIISTIGRKSWRLRLLIWSIYTILSVGSISMVYPFTMMISLSLTSQADQKENQFVPRWFYSEDALFRKYARAKYIDLEQFNMRHRTSYPEFDYGGRFHGLSLAAVNWPRIVAVPFDLSDPRVQARIDDYRQWKGPFIAENPNFTVLLFNTTRAQSTVNILLDRYVDFLMAKYSDLEGINNAYNEENRELRDIYAIRERPTFRTFLPGRGLKFDEWAAFKKSLAEEDLEFINIGEIENEWGVYLRSIYGTEESANEALGLDTTSFYRIPLPFTCPPDGPTESEKLIRSYWVDFAKRRAPLRFLNIENPDARYREFLQKKYSTIQSLNGIWETSHASFDEISFPSEIAYSGAVTNDIYAFVESDLIAPEEITIRSVRWRWMDFLQKKYGDLDAANAAHSISYDSWDQVTMPRRLPLNRSDVEQRLWKGFVGSSCPLDYLLKAFSRKDLRDFLRGEYGDLDALNAAWSSSFPSFEKIRLPESASELLPAREKDLREMLTTEFVPLFVVNLPDDMPDTLYTDYLKEKFVDVQAFNAATRLYPSWEEVKRPIEELDWADYTMRRKWLVREFLVGNYRAVIRYMALHGRAFINTLILCASMILAALTVNPLCAYALSRFQLSYANSILLFLLATMAFPVAVTQIPNFLLLKDLHLLNTYWALILPGLANGYSIFLLKGFFDSLPQELFEAGLIDGASEVQMFYRIALPLTKPVLAVIALGAFTLAYGQFMWAFIVCQNPKYWTIMVFLYQFQQDYSTPLVMAGLVLASVPTLIVFIAAQKVILRGIVVPQMK